LGVFGDVIGQELQGDKPVQRYVFGLVDDTDTTAAELFEDAVVRDRRPCSALPEIAALDTGHTTLEGLPAGQGW
jgi:hypothetical protein